MCLKLFEKCKFVGKAAVAFKVFFNSCDSSVKNFDIGEDKFKVDDFDVAACVYAAVNMDYVVVVKAADNVDKSINFADVCKEFVAETFAFCGAFNKTCDVNKFNGCGGVFFRLVNFRKFIKAGFRNSNNAYVGFNGAERIVCCLCAGIGDCVKKGGFSYVGKSDHSEFHNLKRPFLLVVFEYQKQVSII